MYSVVGEAFYCTLKYSVCLGIYSIEISYVCAIKPQLKYIWQLVMHLFNSPHADSFKGKNTTLGHLHEL
jgi:hypothetical protein